MSGRQLIGRRNSHAQICIITSLKAIMCIRSKVFTEPRVIHSVDIAIFMIPFQLCINRMNLIFKLVIHRKSHIEITFPGRKFRTCIHFTLRSCRILGNENRLTTLPLHIVTSIPIRLGVILHIRSPVIISQHKTCSQSRQNG